MPSSANEQHEPGAIHRTRNEWDRRFIAAVGAYVLLAVMAGLTLSGVLRVAVWALLGGLAIKTFLVWRRMR